MTARAASLSPAAEGHFGERNDLDAGRFGDSTVDAQCLSVFREHRFTEIPTVLLDLLGGQLSELGVLLGDLRAELVGRQEGRAGGEALGVTVGQIVKSLVFTAAGRPLLVAASGANRVDERRLAELANEYLMRHHVSGCPCRFDVVSIHFSAGSPTIEIIQNAFDV